ncbi:MAG: hypothetical protein ACFE9L_18700 [Candidatus Hodarchaeota archaeon]
MIEIRRQYKIIGLLIIASFIFNFLPVNHGISTSNSEIDSLIGETSDILNEVYQTAPSDPLINIEVENSESVDMEPADTTESGYWVTIENETENSDIRISKTYIEAAQKFEIIEENANITQVKLYIRYVDLLNGDGDYPRGTMTVSTDNNGEPGNVLGTTTLEEGFLTASGEPLDLGLPSGPKWKTYTFSKPINVKQGFYWIVLSDTGNHEAGYWEWHTQTDLTNGDTGVWAVKSTHDGSWVLNPDAPCDLLSEVKICPISEPEPEPMKYWFIFTRHGKKKSLSYNVTFTVEHEIKTKLNKEINFFLINIETIDPVIAPKSETTDRVILGVIISNFKSLLIFLQDEFQIDEYQFVVIVLKVPWIITEYKYYHVTKVLSSKHWCKRKPNHKHGYKHTGKQNHNQNHRQKKDKW